MNMTGPMIIGGIFALIGTWQLVHAFRRRSYVEVEGVVVSSQVHTVQINSDTAPSYSLDLVVQYECGGRTFVGSPRSYSASGDLSFGAWECRAAQYVPGERVRVFCDPERPKAFVVDSRFKVEQVVMGLFLVFGPYCGYKLITMH